MIPRRKVCGLPRGGSFAVGFVQRTLALINFLTQSILLRRLLHEAYQTAVAENAREPFSKLHAVLWFAAFPGNDLEKSA
jgi:hypothetical protein